MNIKYFVIGIIVILLLSWLQQLLNNKKFKRAYQWCLVPLSFLYTVAVSVCGYVLMNRLENIHLSLLSGQGFLDNPINTVFELINHSGIVFYNIIILAGFLLLKLPLRLLVNYLWDKFSLMQYTSDPFYGFDEDYHEWFLYEKWVNFRGLMTALYYTFAAGTALWVGVSVSQSEFNVTETFLLPCAALLVFGEIYGYIFGQTKREFEHDVYGDNSLARRISNYYKLREVLEKLLPSPMLTAGSGMEFSGKTTPEGLIAELSESDDISDVVTARYFEVNDRVRQADVDSFKATLNIMHRKNVIFHNPFYRDMTLYITLPLINSLLSGKKCTVIVGRNSLCEDVVWWLEGIMTKYSHMNSFWRVRKLQEYVTDCEIGILTLDELYNHKLITNNRAFFNETDFTILIEPSRILNTTQTALSIIAKEMQLHDEPPIYLVFDRQVGGLVDTLSHVLRSEFIDVSAAPLSRCVYTGITWDADGNCIRQQLFDRQTRFLGNGVELAAIAVKNQIPVVSWYSETKAPIKDIKWISGQYYSTICRYMNIPVQQNQLYEKIKFVSGMWSTGAENEQFVIAEDEFCNMFSMMRTFVSRGISQSFVNILSENYLLRDYMRCNRQMFTTNPEAVPSLVPDYAKTERNTLIKLLIMMTISPILEDVVTDELRLVGIESVEPINVLSEWIRRFTFADPGIIQARRVKRVDDEMNVTTTFEYWVTKEEFDIHFADSLKSAYYVVENEQYQEDHIDAKMFNHVVQQIMPGQFVTYDGKYYLVRHISPKNGVILRRAADLYSDRKYYRQIRKYFLNQVEDDKALRSRSYMDMDIEFHQTDIRVETTGYVELNDNHNLKTANVVDLTDDPETVNFSRKYRSKTFMRVRFRNSDANLRFTFCMILSEIFRSVFADTWSFLAVVSKQPPHIGGMLSYMVYSLQCEHGDDDWIYFIEDSDIDLGLLEAVDRNFIKLLEITTDYLDWHLEKMREPEAKDPMPIAEVERKKKEEKKRSMFQKLADRLRRLLGLGKKGKEEPPVFEIRDKDVLARTVNRTPDEVPVPDGSEEPSAAGNDEGQAQVSEESGETDAVADTTQEAVLNGENEKRNQFVIPSGDLPTPIRHFDYDDQLLEDDAPELSDVDGTDIFDTSGMPEYNEWLEMQFLAGGLIPLTKTRYQNECFLKFGFDEIDGRIVVEDLFKYLRMHGLADNALTKARKSCVFDKSQLDLNAQNQCDFCGLPLSAVSYEILNDGRCRCNNCASSAIRTVPEFKEIYFRTLSFMQSVYNIQYHFPIRIQTTDAKKVAKGVGRIFIPSSGQTERVLGYAQSKSGKYSIVIENGAPRLAAIETIVHELTHIWQFVNWNDKQIGGLYQMAAPSCMALAKDLVFEGMSVWASVQYLYQIGEESFAAEQEAYYASRTDLYGAGFRLYTEQYPLVRDSSLLSVTPFTVFPPVDPDNVRMEVKMACCKKNCNC